MTGLVGPEPVEDGEPTVDASALAEPPAVILTAITVPLMGEINFAPAKFCWAVSSELVADATDARSDASWSVYVPPRAVARLARAAPNCVLSVWIRRLSCCIVWAFFSCVDVTPSLFETNWD